MPGILATEELSYWVQQACYIEPGLGKNHNVVTPNFAFRFGKRRRGSYAQNQQEFYCLARTDCPGDMDGGNHSHDPGLSTEYLVDQTFNMKLRFIAAAVVGVPPGDILALFKERVGLHIDQAVPPSHQVHQHWVEKPWDNGRDMVLKWSKTIAGWQENHSGAMCPHRLSILAWRHDTAVQYDKMLADPWAIWGYAALHQGDK